MDLKPIKIEADYRQALAEVESLFDVELNTPEGNKLEILTTLIEAYESKHYPIELALPYEAILYYLESRNQPISSFIKGFKYRGVTEDLINETLNDIGKV
ncbi:helix-turn-helix domain-containing protein [Oscillatoria salina]|uniref:helix-turn-helix domain-containing protein n=1 Tax=Oscillatoria salina TaxID=331517 RepID=UPI001CCADD3C|nr:transcriptional regulator [Oscillatoria salina]MBZ8183134.1 transcriptional regulator [Oscillatoria salina IIICB1]